MANTAKSLTGLVLSATEIQELTGWSDPMVEDYLTILRNLINIAQDVDIIDDREAIFDAKASQLIAVLNGEISHNQGRFLAHEKEVQGLNQIISVLNNEVNKVRSRCNTHITNFKKIEQLSYAW